MKKLFAVIIALMMLLSAAAMAESADFLGDWYLIGIESEGTTYSPGAFGMSMSMTLNEDGTAYVESVQGSDPEASEGTWILDGDALTVTIDDDEPQTFVLVDEMLVTEDEDSVMVFGREPEEIEVYTPAEVIEAEETDFDGSWTAFKYGMDGVFMDAATIGMDMDAEFDGDSLLLTGFLGSETPYTMTFADSAYSFETDDESQMIASIKAELLEDGNLQLTMTFTDSNIVLIMAPTEAAE